MLKYHCLNPIASVGLERFTDQYAAIENAEEADVILSEVQPCMTWNLAKT